MPASLGKFETNFYFFAWIGSVLYSIYNVSLSSDYFKDYHDTYDDFSIGWSWIGLKQDVSDHEWFTWIPLMFHIAPWVFCQLLIGQMIRSLFNVTILYCWFITISIAFLSQYIGVLGTLCLLIQPCIASLISSICNKSILWVAHLTMLILLNVIKSPDNVVQTFLGLEDRTYYMFTLAACWMQLRCISYSIDSITHYRHVDLQGFFQHFLQNLTYALYLPTLFFGPIILFDNFLAGIDRSYTGLCTLNFLKSRLLNLTRYVFWLYFTEFSLHFVYFNVLQYHPKVVENLNPWALYGYGYCMGQYFLNKYVVVYGISSEICRIDGIEAPGQPKCIGRIHLYSDMWKYFDQGLYKFLVRYIYKPTAEAFGNSSSKLIASFLCFGFVFLWHGMQTFIFIWAFLNFLGLAIEHLAKFVSETKRYIWLEKEFLHLNARGTRRLHCILASPLLALSAFSNFYFFAGQQIGTIFLHRILYYESWIAVTFLLFFLYCCCQVSTEIKMFEKERQRKSGFMCF